ncbi:MAG: hypothetical protein JWO31_504 [Phycisphaerales bacterium]|nr:hypothetical protein [Phycisphaerales bacterium]
MGRNPNKIGGLTERETFVSSYTSADETRIRFAWNGKHAEEFVDSNAEFRSPITALVVSSPNAAPIELVRDLFKAETEFSREAWGIEFGVGALAERLLRCDPERFLEDYLRGKFQSFDAHLGSAFDVEDALTVRLLEIVQRRLEGELPPERRELLERGSALFQDWTKSS